MSSDKPEGAASPSDETTPISAGEWHGHTTNTYTGVWQPPTVQQMQAMLPQYQFIEMLGAGGMGAVYKAMQTSLDRLVAIKILPPGLDDGHGANFADRFKLEARTMAKMNHPNIVHVHDSGETPSGQLYFVMEFVEGTDVRQMIRENKKIAPRAALEITVHVCDALEYAHARGVIHRDIKPANVLIGAEGAVKIADFGIAKAVDSTSHALTRSNIALGTPQFMAPEALSTDMKMDSRADLYAVGVMLHNMLTGEIPSGMFKLPSKKIGCDARFDDIVKKAMAADREERYQTAAQIRKDLDTIATTTLAKVEAGHAVSRPAVAGTPNATPGPVKIMTIISVIAVSLAGLFAWSPWNKRDVLVAASPPVVVPAAPKEVVSSQQTAVGPMISPGSIADILTSPDYEWTPPENLGAGVNSAKNEYRASLSDDGLDVVFSSDRQDTGDLFECRRIRVDQPFGTPVGIRELNHGLEGGAFLSGDGLTLLYQSTEGPTLRRGKEIFQSRRRGTGSPWESPENLGSAVNSFVSQGSASLSRDGLTLVFSSSRPISIGIHDLWRCRRKSLDSPFGSPENLGPGVNGKGLHSRNPFVVPDDSGVLFGRSYDDNLASTRLFIAIPDAHGEFMAVPVLLPVEGGVDGPTLSPDGLTLYFVSDCPGGFGGADIWKTHHVPKKKTAAASGRTDASGDWISLMDKIDPAADAVKGTWTLVADGVSSVASNSPAIIQLPYAPSSEYDFRVEFTTTRSSPDIAQLVAAGGKDIAWKLGAAPYKSEPAHPDLFGFEMVDGKYFRDNPTKTVTPWSMLTGHRYTSVVQVRKDSVTGLVDGKVVTHWKTDFKDMSVQNSFKLRDAGRLGLGIWDCAVTFHDISVREVTGNGKLLR